MPLRLATAFDINTSQYRADWNHLVCTTYPLHLTPLVLTTRPSRSDGVPGITQYPIKVGHSLNYTWWVSLMIVLSFHHTHGFSGMRISPVLPGSTVTTRCKSTMVSALLSSSNHRPLAQLDLTPRLLLPPPMSPSQRPLKPTPSNSLSTTTRSIPRSTICNNGTPCKSIAVEGHYNYLSSTSSHVDPLCIDS